MTSVCSMKLRLKTLARLAAARCQFERTTACAGASTAREKPSTFHAGALVAAAKKCRLVRGTAQTSLLWRASARKAANSGHASSRIQLYSVRHRSRDCADGNMNLLTRAQLCSSTFKVGRASFIKRKGRGCVRLGICAEYLNDQLIACELCSNNHVVRRTKAQSM
jgi:hypothetical protein